MPDNQRPLNRDEFETLVKAQQAGLFRYARYLGADPSAAEDIVQDTFLAVIRGGVPEGESAQAAWLRGIARNLFLRHCRTSRRSPITADEHVLEQAELAWAREFLREGDGFDYVEALRRCLNDLPADRRRVIELQYAAKKSRAEIARICGMTENGVKSTMRRLRAVLAVCISRRLAMENPDGV